MASIMTNASALTALQSLNSTNKNLEVTQSRISTGYRVAEASDNAAYWSIATTMRSDHRALSTVQDSLGLGASKVDTAYTGMQKAIDTVNDIKVKLVAANGASAADKEKIDVEIKALQGQLKSYADAATFSGANWLSVDTTTGHTTAGTFNDVKIVASFNRSATGTVSLGTIDVKVQDIKLYDAFATATGLNDGILDAAASARLAPAVERLRSRPAVPLRPRRHLHRLVNVGDGSQRCADHASRSPWSKRRSRR